MSRNLPYSRADRIAKQVYQVVASYFYENVDDERLGGLQITGVKMTKDLSIARVYYYIAGDKDRQKKALEALEEIRHALKHLIGQELVLKMIPQIEYHLDEGVVNAERVEELLKQINK
jgi:ribosome-binding factor A